MYLSLPIPEETKKEISLYQCINEFIKEEKLDKEESWYKKFGYLIIITH